MAHDAAKADDKARDGSRTDKRSSEKVDDAKKTAGNTADGAKRADNASQDAPECEGNACRVGPKCFAADTLVLTAAGNRAIESLKEGELVWARDERGGDLGLRPITHVFVTPSKSVLNLSVEADGDSENLTETPGHPFWVEGNGWVASDELAEGATLWSPEGIRHHHRGAPSPKRTTIYNLEVDGFHTYFVGKLHTWVHEQSLSNCDSAKWCRTRLRRHPHGDPTAGRATTTNTMPESAT